MKKRNLLLILVIAFFMLALAIGIVIMVKGSNDKDNDAEIKNKINPLIASFYEDDYFLSTEVDEIKSLATDGLTMRISDLEEMNNTTLDIDCDKEASTITIYPKEPFEAKDYKIVYHLDCDK